MQLLSVAAGFYRIHHNVLCCHEGQLAHQAFLDNLRVYHQTVYYIQIQIQDTVDGQECFRNAQTLVCRVIQSSLKPLGSRGNGRIQSVHHHIAGQGSNTLTAHRISLVSHGGRTDLGLFKGLLDLFQMLQETDIVREFMSTGSDTGQNIDHTGIHLTGIGLSGYGIAGLESHLLSDHGIDLVDGFLISVEQLQKACLGSCGTLTSQKLHAVDHVADILIIQHQFLQPQGCSLTYCCRLSRLEMSKGQCRQSFVFIRKFGQLGDDIHQFFLYQLQGFRHYDNICIIANVAGCGAQMNDRFCLRTLYTKSIYMRHNVVAYHFLTFFGHIIIDIVHVSFHLIDLLLGNIQSQLFLCLCKGDPESSPGTEFHIRRKNILHLLTGITFG